MKDLLFTFGINSNNSIVIGSSILQALEIRDSGDIDLVVSQDAFIRLRESGKLTVRITQHRGEVLINEQFEFGTYWDVLGKKYKFNDLKNESVIIGGVRYITLDFLYKVKSNWLNEGIAESKDINDLKLVEEYKKRQL